MTDTIQSEKNLRKAVFLGLLAGLLILPMFSYMQFTFTATTPELKQKAYDILVNYRIPLHSLPEIWLTRGGAKVQCILPLLALILVRKTRLFLLILVPYIFAVVLTILQILIHNDFLAFIAPWRMSVFLVPLSTAVILGWIISHLLTQKQDTIWIKRLVTGLSLMTISVLVVVGANKQVELLNYEGDSTPLLEFVRLNKQPEDLYLIPPDYKDLQKFRLYTGAPIFINRKSHPYKDIEVIAWYNRVETALSIYQNNDCSRLKEIISEVKITHAVAQNEQHSLNCKFLEAIYQDNLYKVYKIQAIAADS
ncbi:MAG: hypothetical protein HC890_18585 [Chloroflexaceae bacterium]|nr:hypothetical protein [Chloroflexaceae bacterium]